MIDLNTYTLDEIDRLYSVVENAVGQKRSVALHDIISILKPGDFYLDSIAANGPIFTFNGLRWKDRNRIYTCYIQPQVYHGPIIEWYPVITMDQEYLSSGDLSMIKRENRVI